MTHVQKTLSRPMAVHTKIHIMILVFMLVGMPTLVAAGWVATGNLNNARGFHAASLLLDGRVLVTGGREPAPGLIRNSAEIYDPTTNGWSLVAPMLSRRNQHESVTLLDGRVLVMGGDSAGANTNVIATAELFNPTTSSWASATSMHLPRTNFTATRLLDGTVLVVGGSTSNSLADNTASAERYNPVSNTWTLVASMSLNRRFHSATLLADGRVLVSGGVHWFGAGSRTERSAEVYDPATNTWTSAGSMNIHRESHPSVRLLDGRVVAVGTNNLVDLYDPATNTWVAAANILEDLSVPKHALLPSGAVLIVGGSFSTTTQIYDPQSDTWSLTDPMSVGRFAHTSTALTDGRVLVAGGENPLGVPIQTAEVFTEEQSGGGGGPNPADLAVTKTASADTITVGEELIYTITVTNNGPATTEVQMVDRLPTGNKVEFIAVVTTHGTCSPRGPKPQVINCSLGELLDGESAIITMSVTATKAGDAVNQVRVSGQAPDFIQEDNTAQAVTLITLP